MPIPDVPKIGSVLFNFYIKSFDSAMKERFGELPYARLLSLAIIGVPPGVNPDQKLGEIRSLITSLNITASTRTLVPGGPPSQDYFQIQSSIFLAENGTVQVFLQEDQDEDGA